MSLTEKNIQQIIADIQQGKVYETELSNYAAGTRTKISIEQGLDKQVFIIQEHEQDAYSLDEWTNTLHLSNVNELTLYLSKIIDLC